MSRSALEKNVVVTGLTAAGKTTHARRLAAALGYEYVSGTATLAKLCGLTIGRHPPRWTDMLRRSSGANDDLDRALEAELLRLSHEKDGQVFDVWALAWTTDAPIVRVWLESDGPSRYRKCFVSQGPSAARALAECATFVDEKDQFNRDLFDRMLGSTSFATTTPSTSFSTIPTSSRRRRRNRPSVASQPSHPCSMPLSTPPCCHRSSCGAGRCSRPRTTSLGPPMAADRTMSSTAWTADWRTAEAEQRVLSELVETTPLALASLSHCWALGVAYSESRRLAVAIGVRCLSTVVRSIGKSAWRRRR